ncbi:MAG: helix-turn-helix domain-containing protein [Candidatus Methylomirabilis oxyfera]|nr:helix-turn-helix domain-containing protein [Candidatus Methylomirabilis oxyfera]
MTETPQKRYYRPDEVAAILRVSLATVYRRIEDGTLPAVQIGAVYRIPVSAVDSPSDFTLK